MTNLHRIVRSAITGVNPDITVIVKQSDGYTVDENYNQVPSYTYVTVPGQKQPLSSKDIFRLNNLNIQGVHCKMYFYGSYASVIRKYGKGGDLVVIGEDIYLVTVALEQWPDWCCVALTLQVDNAS